MLDLDRTPEEIQAHQRGLAALPGDGSLWNSLRFQVLADICLQQFIGHPEAAARIKALL